MHVCVMYICKQLYTGKLLPVSITVVIFLVTATIECYNLLLNIKEKPSTIYMSHIYSQCEENILTAENENYVGTCMYMYIYTCYS